MQDVDDQVLTDWCDQETSYWAKSFVGHRDFDLDFERLNEQHHSIFIIDIVDGVAKIRSKSKTSGSMISTGAQEVLRIGLYKEFIQESLRRHAPELSVTIALDVHDLPINEINSPVFCFQKTASSRHILLPDVDFMQHGWYQTRYDEPAFADKKPRGIFVGSSTGGGILSCTDVVEARPQRLHLARALQNHPSIDFTIAMAVQCDSPATEALLMQQPYFSKPLSWEEQLKNRFLISVDGNGATCSRVVNSLRSRSVLLKFSSQYQLFYFHGLQPWLHYIPIEHLSDIENAIEEGNTNSTSYEYIVDKANSFFESLLSKDAVHLYGAKLLCAYARHIAPKGLPELARHRAESNLLAGASTYVAALGDVLSGPGEWAGDWDRCRPIEGLSLVATADTNPSLLRYRCLTSDGETPEWSCLGSYSGSRGSARAVTGIEFDLAGRTDEPALVGLVRFLNGAVRKIDPEGGVYREADGSPITALKVWLS